MRYSDNSINILTAIRYKGIGKAWIVSNWRKNLTDDEIVEFINQSTKGEQTTVSEFNEVRKNIIQRVSQQKDFADGVVGWLDEDYPFCRGNAKKGDFPIALFYKGDISLLNKQRRNVAVIGVLKPEESVIQRERRMVSSLLKYGYVIVSGLALGCDSVAHIRTLEENGKTVAVLPSPLDNVIPNQHKELAQEIVQKGGLLITEYFEEPKSQMEMRGRYQERDRLQAMFSDAIILTASYDVNKDGNDSGSRLAMEYARQYHIPRYVMYNEQTDSSHPQFELNRRILREGESQVLTQNKISSLTTMQSMTLDFL
ncbi:MAG: DNA-processing protein DprA [Paludibacteraceae bacterium]|nr:DNA-processing protein DprA [Bacteroidales bacterium]MBP5476193.1 DNA-processing protein DprA [Paludibacteraceae bacterium]